MKSDTPRTDAAIAERGLSTLDVPLMEFARMLERELFAAELRAEQAVNVAPPAGRAD